MPLVLTVQASRDPHAAGRPFGLGGSTTGRRAAAGLLDDPRRGETAAFRGIQPDGPLGGKGRIVLTAAAATISSPSVSSSPICVIPWATPAWRSNWSSSIPLPQRATLVHHGKEPPQRMLLLADLPEVCEQDDRDGVFGAFWYDATRKPSGNGPGEGCLHRGAGRPPLGILQGGRPEALFSCLADSRNDGRRAMPPEGQQIVPFEGTPAATELKVERFIASARPDTMPLPLPFSKMRADGPRAQARVRLTVDGAAEEFRLGATPADPLESPPENVPDLRRPRTAGGPELRADEVGLGVQVFLRSSAAGWIRRQPGGVLFQPDRLPRRGRTQLAEQGVGDMNQPVDFTDPPRAVLSSLSTSFRSVSPRSSICPDRSRGSAAACSCPGLTLNDDPGRGLKYLGCL